METPSSITNWVDSSLANTPSMEQLKKIQTHLELVLLGLEALTNINPNDLSLVAQDLGLNMVKVQSWKLWQERHLSKVNEIQETTQPLTIEEGRLLIVIICHLCQENQELIRRAVTLLEQMMAQNKDPLRISLLKDYFEHFKQLYHGETPKNQSLPPQQLSKLAFKLLVDLLFYSTTDGHRRLWLAVLDYTR